MSGTVPPLAARPLGRVAGVPQFVCPGCNRCGRGDPAPASQRAPSRASVARCGGCGRASPGGGADRRCEGRLTSEVRRSPSPGCPPLSGRAVWVRHPRAVGAGVQVWGPGTVPLACMPCGGGGAVPGGVGLPPLRGLSGVRRCPSPSRPGAGCRGSATRVPRVRSVRAWGPSTGPTACALAGRRCSLWGWRRGVHRGGAFHCCEGRLRSGAPPPPTACLLDGLSGSATHVLWARVCGCGRAALFPWLARPVGAACRGGGGGPSPGGVARHRCEGHLSSGAPPPSTARPLGGPLPSATHVLWARVRGCRGPALSLGPHALRGLHAAGVAGGRPRGGWPASVVRGVWCQALSLPQPPVLCGGQPGFRDPCVPGAVGAGVGA